MRRDAFCVLLRSISLVGLGLLALNSGTSAANPRLIRVLDKAYISLLSRERNELTDDEKKAAMLKRADAICAFELAPHNSWSATGEWKVVASEIEALPPIIPEPEPTGYFGVVKKHKIFKKLTCVRAQNPTLTDIVKDQQLIKSGQLKLIRPLSLLPAPNSVAPQANRALSDL